MKNRIQNKFLALTLLATLHSVQAQITNLSIAPAGNQLVLFWPTTITNPVLQSATNLASTNWVNVANAVPVTAVTVTNASPAMYFRLSEPPTPSGMALIPAGSFLMGDTLDSAGGSDAYPLVPIYVSAFYMDTNLVTYLQWGQVYFYGVANNYGFDNPGSGRPGATQPVQSVNWYDVVKWCNARSLQASLTPVYYTDSTLMNVYINGDVVPFVNTNANGFRLPTEAEWEKAARGGMVGQRFPWGDTISGSEANYYGNTGLNYDLGGYNGYNTNFDSGAQPYTSPVGSFPPNGYGLNDMAGNVYEWCWDWHGTPYGQPSTNNPTGPSTGTYRIFRGGCWNCGAANATCANRQDNPPSYVGTAVGFRCVRGH